jgi:hypothetical protein
MIEGLCGKILGKGNLFIATGSRQILAKRNRKWPHAHGAYVRLEN